MCVTSSADIRLPGSSPSLIRTIRPRGESISSCHNE